MDPHIQARLSLDHDKMIRVLSERSRRRSSGVLHTRLGPGPASFPKTRTLATLEDEGGVSSPNLERKRTIRLHSSPPSSPMGRFDNLVLRLPLGTLYQNMLFSNPVSAHTSNPVARTCLWEAITPGGLPSDWETCEGGGWGEEDVLGQSERAQQRMAWPR